MRTFWQDLRYGARMLMKRPGFTLIAVGTLAIGIGLNTALFSVVNSILLRPLPFHEPERLMQVWETWPDGQSQTGAVSQNNLLDWRAQARSFATLSGYSIWLFTLTGTNEPTEIPGLKVTANFFAALGVTPQLGRTFRPEEDRPGVAQSVVISHDFWRRRFGGRADVIGQPLRLDDNTYTIAGVLRSDFRQTGFSAGYRAEVWVPLALDPAAPLRGSHSLRVIGRLQPGATEARTQIEMNAMIKLSDNWTSFLLEGQPTDPGRAPTAKYALVSPDFFSTMETALGEVVARPRFNASLFGLFAAVALILAAIGLFGVMSYTVTQSTREIGIRMALGAQARDVLKLVVGQGLALTIAGVVIGLVGAWGLTRLMKNLLYGVTATDPLTFICVPLLLVSIALLACYIPARRATKVDPIAALKCE